jgi:hypothetical protein
MTIEKYQSTFIGVGELKMRRVSDNLVYHLPTPMNMVVEPGKNERVLMGRNKLGRRVEVASFIDAENPVLNISYGVVQPELLQFRLGNYFETTTKELYLPTFFDLANGGTFPAVTAPSLGHAVINGADAIASIKRPDGLSQPLTEGTDFTIGAGGQVTFSSALVAAKETVSMLIPYTVTGLGIGSELIGRHEVVATIIDSEGYVWFFHAPNAKPSAAGGSIDFSAESFDLQLKLYNSGGCQPFTLIKSSDKVSC